MSEAESWRTRFDRWKFNLFPAYRGTGARVTYIRHDWSEVRIAVPLSWRTRNYVGTIFGGSLYGAIDPIYMLMLMRSLGPEYVVWDKAATIRFRRPGRTRLTATFRISPELLGGIREELTRVPKLDRVFSVELVDQTGIVHVVVEKTVHMSRRGPPDPTRTTIVDR
jgi:acyl-coenzyme A thioesterase PaaI-like protein